MSSPGQRSRAVRFKSDWDKGLLASVSCPCPATWQPLANTGRAEKRAVRQGWPQRTIRGLWLAMLTMWIFRRVRVLSDHRFRAPSWRLFSSQWRRHDQSPAEGRTKMVSDVKLGKIWRGLTPPARTSRPGSRACGPCRRGSRRCRIPETGSAQWEGLREADHCA